MNGSSRIGRLHVITEQRDGARSHLELARLAVQGGAETVQFREKRPADTATLLEVARRLRSVVSAAGVRKTLQRARAKFSDLLLYEVTQSLESYSLDDLEAELIELGLQPYCKSALERRRAAS